jgi:hypothetical protein
MPTAAELHCRLLRPLSRATGKRQVGSQVLFARVRGHRGGGGGAPPPPPTVAAATASEWHESPATGRRRRRGVVCRGHAAGPQAACRGPPSSREAPCASGQLPFRLAGSCLVGHRWWPVRRVIWAALVAAGYCSALSLLRAPASAANFAPGSQRETPFRMPASARSAPGL